MELQHHFTVPSSLQDTWRSFNQLEEIAPCFPGATLTGVDGDTFTGTVKIKLGPIAMMYAGTGRFVSRDEGTRTVVIEAQGKDKRGNGTAGATVTAVLAAGEGGTVVEVSTDMNVTGKPAQFGRGVIQDISDKLLEQFVQCVIKKAEGTEEAAPASPLVAPGAAATPPPPSPPTPATATATATATARHAAAPPTAAPELDLGSAMVPVLAKKFGPALAAASIVTVVIACCCRCRKR